VQLQQVLLNLIRNAVDAMSDRPDRERGIHIAVMVEDTDEVSVSVADAGPGITTENLDKLFQPFFTTKRDGMGLGLSLSRSIVEAHGGHLDFTDRPGGGSIFTMTLPTLPGTD
jgi:signal transduction histidine kinase